MASSPLVPRNDPTLMFTNAGMVQFKNVFTGLEKRPYARAVTAQKCVRAGGKHNDLDNVGYTARHHTFFEMLGNFSFGDYFKERAIELAWELVTKEYALPKDRLLFTVYVDDDDAFNLYEEDHRAARTPKSCASPAPTISGRWATPAPAAPARRSSTIMVSTFPAARPARPTPRATASSRSGTSSSCSTSSSPAASALDLPRPSIDTGMGLERIAAVLQGTHDNYAIDLFATLIRVIGELTGVDPDGPQRNSHRVIADHLRASPFLIADGVLPSNEGRGYVLRRIMRRAMRHAELLGAKEPLMFKLVPALTREMGQAYPELIRAEALIEETLKLEETRFRDMLVRGLALLDEKSGAPQEGRHVRRRDRLHALRHLWLSAWTSRRTRCARAASASIWRASKTPWSASARRRAPPGRARARPRRRRCGFRCARGWAPPSSSATTPKAPKAWSRRWSRTARKSPS